MASMAWRNQRIISYQRNINVISINGENGENIRYAAESWQRWQHEKLNQYNM